MEKNKVPESLKHLFSQKKSVLLEVENICDVLNQAESGKQETNKCRLIFYTAGGFISGLPASIDEYQSSDILIPEKGKSRITLFGTISSRNKWLLERESKDSELNFIPDGSAIYLKDVKAVLGGSKVNAPEMIIFSDQIIGVAVSYGDFQV